MPYTYHILKFGAFARIYDRFPQRYSNFFAGDFYEVPSPKIDQLSDLARTKICKAKKMKKQQPFAKKIEFPVCLDMSLFPFLLKKKIKLDSTDDPMEMTSISWGNVFDH